MKKNTLTIIGIALVLSALAVALFDVPARTDAAAPPTPTAVRKSANSGNAKLSAPKSTFGSVTVVHTDTNTLHNETTIAIDPNNSNRVLASARVWLDNDNLQPYAYVYTSTDGGATWWQTDTIKSNNAINGGNPWVTFDKNGNGYQIETAHLAEIPSGIYLAKLSPNNVWSQSFPVSATASSYDDRPFVAVDNTGGAFANRIYASWTKDSMPLTGTIYLSTIDGTTFPTATTFSTAVRVNPGYANVSQWSYIAIGADGAVYVAYVSYGTPNHILISKSTDGGVSFSNTYTVSVANGVNNGGADHLAGSITGTLMVSNGPALVTHPSDPTKLAAVWMDGYGCGSPNQCPHAHIVASYSNTGGASWSSPVIVNDDGDAGNRDHFLPALAVGSDGILHASWYDRRQALNPTNPYLYDEVYSHSTDWGKTWSCNVRVSTASSDPANPNFGSLIFGDPTKLFVGNYSGIAVTSDGSAVMPFWTDATTGKQRVVTARATTPVTGPFAGSCSNSKLYLPLIIK